MRETAAVKDGADGLRRALSGASGNARRPAAWKQTHEHLGTPAHVGAQGVEDVVAVLGGLLYRGRDGRGTAGDRLAQPLEVRHPLAALADVTAVSTEPTAEVGAERAAP